MLPIAALQQVEERLPKFAAVRQALVEAFLAAYPGLSQDAAKRLRGLYNPADYPSMNSAGNLVFSWQYVSFGVPDALKGVSQQVWEQEREKAAQRMAEASCEIQQVLRESMARLVQHMADRLKERRMASRFDSRRVRSPTWSNSSQISSFATSPTIRNCSSS